MEHSSDNSHIQRLLDRILAGYSQQQGPVTHIKHWESREAEFADWPSWALPQVSHAFRDSGVDMPWRHQIDAANAIFEGRHTVISTGTASGKSLSYQLPILSKLSTDQRARALYLSPTKALGADQLRSLSILDIKGVRAAVFDGDTPQEEREWAQAHSRWLITNPDMLHRNLLARHSRWASFFRRLSFVVIDECHYYRGVFGSHVALLLRRLLRIAHRYGANPTMVLASATMNDPADFGTRLTGVECTAITQDKSPRGRRTIVLWEPPLQEELVGENGAPVRRSVGAETSSIMADLVIDGAKSLAFVRSRQGAELAALGARRILAEIDPSLEKLVAAYRGGFLPEDRRVLERSLLSGKLRSIATTNALELGIDIAGLDAVVLAGYPGTLASFWQQAGRAGRSGDHALIIFIAKDDPLDTYLVHHPSAIFERPVETTVLDPTNPYVLGPHLVCAAAEFPLTTEDLACFGDHKTRETVDSLVEDKLLRRRPSGWYWTSHDRPHGAVHLRGGGGEQIAVVESATSRLLGTVNPESACGSIYPGAIYIHQGFSYLVDELDLDSGLAFVHAENPDWTTTPRETVDISVISTHRREVFGGVTVCSGEVAVTSQVVAYLRRLPSGAILDQIPLDLPAQELKTKAVWYTISQDLLMGKEKEELRTTPGGAGLDPARLPGALHAAEHAAIGLLPLFASCDRWDIGGVSTALHGDTGEATVFVHDGHPGGAGFADRGFAAMIPWLTATREAISSCECPTGCPSCVQSPKCGNGNNPLDKAGAVVILDTVLGAVLEHGGKNNHKVHHMADAPTPTKTAVSSRA
jgi:DEAD/DEAH box helicase domain-containing protein